MKTKKKITEADVFYCELCEEHYASVKVAKKFDCSGSIMLEHSLINLKTGEEVAA